MKQRVRIIGGVGAIGGIGAIGLLGSAPVHAELTGFSFESHYVDGLGGGAVTCDLVAQFNNPLDQMLAIGGTPNTPMNIGVLHGTLYQNGFGGDTAPNPLLFTAFPSVEADSFVTIGKTTSNGDETLLTPGWAGFGPSALAGTNLGWFVAPGAPQALPIDGKVTLARLTSFEGLFFHADFLYEVVSDGQSVTGEASLIEHRCHCPTPTPGALAVFLLAGIVPRRGRL